MCLVLLVEARIIYLNVVIKSLVLILTTNINKIFSCLCRYYVGLSQESTRTCLSQILIVQRYFRTLCEANLQLYLTKKKNNKDKSSEIENTFAFAII